MTPSLDQTVIDQSLSEDEEIFEEALEVQDIQEDYDELEGEVASLAREELGETESVVRENVREVRSWLLSQPHLSHCRTDRNFLARFLRTNKHNREKSCKMLERYLKMRTAHPKWFQNLDIEVEISFSRGYVNSKHTITLAGPDGLGAHRKWLHFRVAGAGPAGQESLVQRSSEVGSRTTQHLTCRQSSHRYL